MNKIFSSSLLIILTAALLFSCTKDISKIGVDVVGDNPLEVRYTDTVTIRVYSELVDSLRSDELSSHVLGAYKDPIFGTLNASVYSQFLLEEENDFTPFIGENIELDSIILYIKYASTEVYGDTNYRLNLTVYELGEDIHRDSIYYSFQNLRTKNEILGELNFKPEFDSVISISKPDDPVHDKIDTITRLRPIRIPLSDEFGNKLLHMDTLKYSSQEDFLQEFKGLYITTLNRNVPTSGGSTINTLFDDPQTYIMLYYHNDTSSYINDDDETIYYNHEMKYIVNINAARFSNYNHYDYLDADADFRREVIETAHPDSTVGKQKFYMQGLGGVRTIVEFPYLQKLDDYYNYAINEAKLIIHNIDTDQDPYLPLAATSSLTLSHKITQDSVSDYYLIKDTRGGDRYFGGDYISVEEQYYFRVTQHIQDLLEGKTDDNQLRIETIGGSVNPNRLVAGGSNPVGLDGKKIVLQVIYTKIDDDK